VIVKEALAAVVDSNVKRRHYMTCRRLIVIELANSKLRV
jgi:hypothetical protein